MKKYKHNIYVTTCPECKKLIRCYRFNRLRKMFGKYPYCYCEEHTLWKPKIITEKDFVKIEPLPENILEDADYNIENEIKKILYEYQEKINKKLAEIQDDFFIKTLKFLGFKKEINEKNMAFISIFMEENNIKIYCYMDGYIIKKNNKIISILQPKYNVGEIEFTEEFFEENL